MIQSKPDGGQDIVIVTGPAGAGRTTAIGAFEDLGFEAIDNLPISLLQRLFTGAPIGRSVVIGIDPRNRDFGVDRLLAELAQISTFSERAPVLVYVDCDATTLMRRYNETRRRHPMSPDGSPATGIERELALLAPLRERADVLIETSSMSPHELRAQIAREFGGDAQQQSLAITLHSFSYKRGNPRSADMVIDARFLRNPHWVGHLRERDGRDPEVAAYVAADTNFEPFYTRFLDLLLLLLPAYRAEGRSYFSLAIGCTGGRHRSVTLVEALAKSLAGQGWQVSIRHRDLDRTPKDAALMHGVGSG